MITTVISKNGISIRLPHERWIHIVEEHGELAGRRLEVLETVHQPDRILAGGEGELLAVREVEPGKFLIIAYRELVDDGFIITAFLTCRAQYLNRRQQLWP